MRLLVVEDNIDIQRNIADYLEGFCTLDFAYNGEIGLSLMLSQEFDVIILDLMLPRMNGLEVCRRYQKEANLISPILMLTARDTMDDKELGFCAGADDYLVKPFSMRELKLRIEALARRPKRINTKMFIFEGLSLSANDRQLATKDKVVELNQKETQILLLLMQSAPLPVTKETLSYSLWGEDAPESGALRTHVYNLRKLLLQIKAVPDVKSIRNKGYALVSPA